MDGPEVRHQVPRGPEGRLPAAADLLYYWIGQKGFSEENPQAREILASVFVPKEDITAMNGVVKDGKSMDDAISEWVGTHGDLLERWENIKSY